MDDLISRQAAIDAAKDWYEGLICGSVNGLIKRLKALPTVPPEPQWIPVKREVPEMPGYYITSSEYGGVTVDFYYDHFWNARKNAYRVLAWMPLPKIYKPNK